MNKKEIEELIKFVSKSGVSEVSLELKDFKLTVKNNNPTKEQVIINNPVPMMAAPAQATAVQQVAPAPSPAPKAVATASAEVTDDDSKYIQIKSPMVGTFYRASSPDKPNFSNVGDEIKPGKVLCIIEAMKLFNEIESEVSGRIVKVLVENSVPVEYDQPLFLVDPS